MTLLGGDGNGNAGGGSAGGASGGGGGAGNSPAAGGAGATGGAGSGNAGSGGAAASWRDSLPEDIRGNATLGKYADLSSLAKAHIELQGFVGKKGIFPPGEKATPEQWKEFYKQAGQPEFDKFGVKIPDGKQANGELVDGFKKFAHENGLMPHQAQGLLDWFLGQEESTISSKRKEIELESKTQHDNLRKEWGDGYDRQVSIARLAVKEFGGDEFAQYLDSTGLGNDVALIKVLAKAGAALGEDKIRGEGGGSLGGQTPDEINKEIAQVMGDMKNPYFDRKHPGHAIAVKEMEARYRALEKFR